jgi:hypothetical protein
MLQFFSVRFCIVMSLFPPANINLFGHTLLTLIPPFSLRILFVLLTYLLLSFTGVIFAFVTIPGLMTPRLTAPPVKCPAPA